MEIDVNPVDSNPVGRPLPVSPPAHGHVQRNSSRRTNSGKRRLPIEMRSLISSEAGLHSGSDSEDDVGRLVATVKLQRAKVGRLRIALAVCIAVPFGVGLGVAGTLVHQRPPQIGPPPGNLAITGATTQCREAAQPQFRSMAVQCSEAGGYCVASSEQCNGSAVNKIHFPCSDSCGCCVDNTRCPPSWIGDVRLQPSQPLAAVSNVLSPCPADDAHVVAVAWAVHRVSATSLASRRSTRGMQTIVG